jgi:ADP-ribose pyrophosphatase
MRKRKVDGCVSRKNNSRVTLLLPLLLMISFIFGYVLSNLQYRYRSLTNCAVSLGGTKYKGTQYTSQATVGTPKCLVESKFLKLQQHSVQLEGTTEVIEDWLWIDYHDRINVLIEAPQSDHSDTRDEAQFIVLQQTKYALEGRTSLAIVGGIIEPGESPDNAAKREVLEETGYSCDQFHFLGRYRTDVNRGMGWTNTYVARLCTATHNQATNHETAAVDEVGKADTEQQKLITMSLTEVQEAVMAGKFLEIQWSATVALAVLLYEKKGWK